jgi:hypothetical protein
MKFLFGMVLPAIYQVTTIYTSLIPGSRDTEIIGIKIIDKTANWPFEGREDVREFKTPQPENNIYRTTGESVAVVVSIEDAADILRAPIAKKLNDPKAVTGIEEVTPHVRISKHSGSFGGMFGKLKQLNKHHGYPTKILWFDGPVNDKTYDRCMKWLDDGAKVVQLERNLDYEVSDEEISWQEENMR